MARREREIVEHAVHTVAEQAAKADDLVDEAIAVGHGRSDPLVVSGLGITPGHWAHREPAPDGELAV